MSHESWWACDATEAATLHRYTLVDEPLFGTFKARPVGKSRRSTETNPGNSGACAAPTTPSLLKGLARKKHRRQIRASLTEWCRHILRDYGERSTLTGSWSQVRAAPARVGTDRPPTLTRRHYGCNLDQSRHRHYHKEGLPVG